VELPAEPTRTGDMCLGGEREEVVNPELRRVLNILVQTEEKLRKGALAENC